MRYNRFEIRRRPGIATPGLYIDLASHGELFYSKIKTDSEKSNKTLVITEHSKSQIVGFIREDHPWFNISLIKENSLFRMRSHAKIVTYFLRDVIGIGRDFL